MTLWATISLHSASCLQIGNIKNFHVRTFFTSRTAIIAKIKIHLSLLMTILGDPALNMLNMNKANLRDLIAATSLKFCLKLDSNHPFFGRCDLQIWWMTSKNNRAPLLYYIKLCASFQTHWWIQTAVTVQKCSIWVRIGNFLSCVTLKFVWSYIP